MSFDSQQVRRKFDRAAATYSAAAVLQDEVTQRLAQRLEYIRIEPRTILDLGSGTGFALPLLQQRFPKARLFSLDLSAAMLQQQVQRRWRHNPARVCADMQALPFTSQQFDLVFSSLSIQWLKQPGPALAEIQRVLAPSGLLMLTSLGPQTHQELRQAWAQVDDAVHVHDQYDLHALGDALVAAGFVDSVVDCQLIQMQYASVKRLLQDLKQTGTTNADSARLQGLNGVTRFRAFEQALKAQANEVGQIPLSYEVLFAQAWGRKALEVGLQSLFE